MPQQLKLEFNGQLYPFQQDVLDWSQKINCGIIGLDMGLGKTVITIAMICQRNYKHVMIVLPLQILDQWKRSIIKFTNLKESDIYIYQGRTRSRQNFDSFRIILTTYDVIRHDMSNGQSNLRVSKDTFDCIVFDEAHKMRNKKTITYIMCYNLSQNIPAKWLLTGTTIHNKFTDFSNLCNFLNLQETFSGDSDTISNWRSKYYYRLTKAQCNLQLPEKSIHEHFLNFTQCHLQMYQKLYEETADFYEEYASHPTKANLGALIVKILRLRQCCNHMDSILNPEHYKVSKNRHDGESSAKFGKAIEIIKDAPENDKLIIFSQWEHSLKIFGAHLHKNGIDYLEYNGLLSVVERNQVLKEFREGTKRVMLITITSGGVGLDMSFANHVIIMDSWWNQALEEQAIDRVYRIGQTKKVEVHRLYMIDTIEDWMVKMKTEKLKIDTHFHDDNMIYTANQSLLKEILHKYI